MLSQTTIDPPPPPQKRMVNPKNIYIDLKVQSARTHEPHQQSTAPQTNICQIPVKSPVLGPVAPRRRKFKSYILNAGRINARR